MQVRRINKIKKIGQGMSLRITAQMILRILFFVWVVGYLAFHSSADFDIMFRRLSRVMYFAVGIIFLFCFRTKIDVGKRSILVHYVLFIGYAFLSVLWARNWTDALAESYIDGYSQVLLVAVILSSRIKTKRECFLYLKMLLWAMIIMAIRTLILTPPVAWGAKRIGSAVGWYPTAFGAICAYAVLLSVYFAEQKKLYYFTAVMFAFLTLLTGSRGPILLIAAGTLVFYIWKNRGHKRMRNILILALIGLLFINMIFTNEMLYNVIGKRIVQMLYEYGFVSEGAYNEISIGERSFYKSYALEMFAQKPILGYGSNGFVTEMRRISYVNVAYSHCTYTEILANYGLVGFLLYYCYRFSLLIAGIKKFIKTHDQSVLIAVALIITMLVRDYVGISFYEPFAQVIFILSAKIILLSSGARKKWTMAAK